MESNPRITIKAKDEENDTIGTSKVDKTNGMKKEPSNINISSTVLSATGNANQNPIDVDSTELGIHERSSSRFPSSRILPSVGAFTVQCANCSKWRLIPTKEKYEHIRGHILEKPFYCETAQEWHPDISCDDPTDISQDGSMLWAIDKPNIAQPPHGWQRLLKIRGEGGTRFADVYYLAPSGKRLRSIIEVEKYLSERPQLMEEGVTLSQFSFQIPRPLQENHGRKRPARLALLHDGKGSSASGFAEPSEVNHSPDDTELQLGDQKLNNANDDAFRSELPDEPKRKEPKKRGMIRRRFQR